MVRDVMKRIYCKKTKAVVVIFLMSIICSSCGTIFCVEKEVPALTITSSVPNAEVYLNGRYVGQTPYSHFGEKVNVKKIAVKKDGYESQSIKPRKLTGWAYINFLPTCTWIWGYFVDRSQSKCWKYKSDVFHFELEKIK